MPVTTRNKRKLSDQSIKRLESDSDIEITDHVENPNPDHRQIFQGRRQSARVKQKKTIENDELKKAAEKARKAAVCNLDVPQAKKRRAPSSESAMVNPLEPTPLKKQGKPTFKEGLNAANIPIPEDTPRQPSTAKTAKTASSKASSITGRKLPPVPSSSFDSPVSYIQTPAPSIPKSTPSVAAAKTVSAKIDPIASAAAASASVVVAEPQTAVTTSVSQVEPAAVPTARAVEAPTIEAPIAAPAAVQLQAQVEVPVEKNSDQPRTPDLENIADPVVDDGVVEKVALGREKDVVAHMKASPKPSERSSSNSEVDEASFFQFSVHTVQHQNQIFNQVNSN